jgi:hypothetical protein
VLTYCGFAFGTRKKGEQREIHCVEVALQIIDVWFYASFFRACAVSVFFWRQFVERHVFPHPEEYRKNVGRLL